MKLIWSSVTAGTDAPFTVKFPIIVAASAAMTAHAVVGAVAPITIRKLAPA
jgi:hypothetical protein